MDEFLSASVGAQRKGIFHDMGPRGQVEIK
jgi:hypothetical protein